MARFGYLYLHGGSWAGRPILSGAFVDLSTKPYGWRFDFKTLRRYGLLWWNNANGRMPGVPLDTFYSAREEFQPHHRRAEPRHGRRPYRP